MPLYRFAKGACGGGFIVQGACVGSLQQTRSACGLTFCNRLEKRIGVVDARDQIGKRSALQNCAQALAMGNPRCLRLFVQLIQQAQLRCGVRSVDR